MIYYADPRAFDDALLQRLTPLLPPEKQTAIARIKHLPARNQAILAWAVLVYALREQGFALPKLAQSETGKPYFEDFPLHFNLSHTDTLVCAALSASPVGIDAQTLTTASDAVVRRVLSPAERKLLAEADDKAALFTRFWTQKEAYAKQTGEGLSCGFSSLDFAPCAQLDAFTAYGCAFRLRTLCGAVMTVCGADDPTPPAEVTQQMMVSLVAQNQG
jgi:4'-phosphopantetheinyl transferase